MKRSESNTLITEDNYDRRLCRLSLASSRLSAAADELLLNSGFEQDLARQIARMEVQIAWFRAHGLAQAIDWHKEQLSTSANT